ncbi:hypothetical protein AAZX31_02G125500 [Glycine max]|uniref:Uncharacterized protein n=2 Tax=Glycine subgen. Soja TaxID=1462606 RepID=K7K835_SOYBN|nr:cold-regulated protein 27 [Glycine max]XP_028204880.1 uncharacterized protein LOC114388540 [Glycine soja]KAG5062989.1 hypothetical protein JHK85_004172 [Glycine max]KAG5079935.1 hypothetical protein JHK86_004000 [Glycine max]KAH1060119.1 hypothetical protein GYH30_003888 [Glycine max]KAH1261335.1 hypothetical protein GmHk_02G004226 [Glycine max]KHN37513.1 hypothetical protein glysoja_034379 [Glycine soja]|eukprot:XP_003520162.1 uncharacterized protein LOC100801828 [Glycine max]
MTWHPNDGTDTCKSEAMWSLFSSPSSEGFFFSAEKLRSRVMEQHDLRRRHSPPLTSDPKPLPELARSASASSSFTVDNNSKGLSHHHSAAPAPPMGQSTRWTDQQHSLYIRSLEASFVNELHHSMRLRCRSLRNSTDEAYKCRILQNLHNMPKQSLALQDDRQKRINLQRVAPMLESTADSHVLAGSQFELTSVDGSCSLREPITCKHGLLCDEEIQIHARGSSTFTDRSPRSLEKQCICRSFHLDLACSTTEVTDQNFKDEEARSSSMPLVKRLKTATADGSSSDQVVPFGKLHIPDVSTSSNAQAQKIKDMNCYENPQ